MMIGWMRRMRLVGWLRALSDIERKSNMYDVLKYGKQVGMFVCSVYSSGRLV